MIKHLHIVARFWLTVIGTFLAVFLLFNLAHGADIGCGIDTDESGLGGTGTVDRWCNSNDQDHDGYPNTTDCDDNNFYVYPGVSVGGTAGGCSAGEYRTCKVDGTGWTSCTATSTTPFCPDHADRTTHSGAVATNCYYFDFTSGSNTTGDGSYANPWKDLSKVAYWYYLATPPFTPHTPAAGDAYILLGDTYNATYDNTGYSSNEFFACRNSVANATNRIWVMPYPGEQVKFTATQPSARPMMYLQGCSYWTIGWSQYPLEITGGYGSGILFSDDVQYSTGVDIGNVFIHDKDNTATANNDAAVYFNMVKSSRVHHSFLRDNFQSGNGGSGPGVENNYNMVSFRDDNNEFDHLVIINQDATADRPGGFKQKHASYDAWLSEVHFHHNIIGNVQHSSISVAGFDNIVEYNLIVDSASGFNYKDHGGRSYMGGTIYRYNTLVNTPVMANVDAHRNWNADESAASDSCSGDVAPTLTTLQYNVYEDDNGSYGTEQSIVQVSPYGPDALYTDFITGSKLAINSNCYYNSAATTLRWGIFEVNNGDTSCAGRGNSGAAYSGLSAFQAAGYEASGYDEDPVLDASYVATSTNCSNWGWAADFTGGAGGTPADGGDMLHMLMTGG